MPQPDEARAPLFRRLLGADYALLPPPSQTLHDIGGGLEAEGLDHQRLGHAPLNRDSGAE